MKNKIIALFATMFVTVSAVGTVAVQANDNVVSSGVDLIYNAEKSTDVTRAIDVYINSNNSYLSAIDFVVTFSPYDEITTKTSVPVPVPNMVDIMTNSQITDFTKTAAFWKNASKCEYSIASTSGAGTPYSGDGYIGTLVLNVTDADTTFTATVKSANIVGDAETITTAGDIETIPAFATEETVTAKSEAFVKEYEGVAAQAFSATLTAEQAAKSVTWVVTDGSKEKTVDTTVDTTVSGESDVVIGLVVSDAVEGLSATVTVK